MDVLVKGLLGGRRPAHQVVAAHTEQRGSDIASEFELGAAFGKQLVSFVVINIDHGELEVWIFFVDVIQSMVAIRALIIIKEINFIILQGG